MKVLRAECEIPLGYQNEMTGGRETPSVQVVCLELQSRLGGDEGGP